MSEICCYTGKVVHTKQKAREHLVHLKKLRHYPGEVFLCKHCNGYHIGVDKHKNFLNRSEKI